MTTVFNELLRVLPTRDLRPATLVASYADELASVVDYFERSLPAEIVKREANHEGCAECLCDCTVEQPEWLMVLPDSTAKRVISLAELYFQLRKREGAAFNLFETLPGVEIIERVKSPYLPPTMAYPQAVCFDVIFFHEPFYCYDTSDAMFNGSLRSVLRTLRKNGYTLSTTPRVGQVVIYSHGLCAEHYARIESIDQDGNITVVSKCGHYHVYRHLINLSIYNDLIVLLDPPRTRPHPLYTSPTFIRAQLLAALMKRL